MISVVICTFNRSHLLRRTLESFFRQTGLNEVEHELLVVDNNSTDPTRELVRELASSSAIRYLFEPRQGLSAARNRGVEQARGDIVAFLDDDVLLDRNWLRNLRRCFEETGADAVGGRSYLVFESSEPDWLGPCFHLLLSEVDLGGARKEVPGGAGLFGLNLAFRKSVLLAAGGFDTSLGRTGSGLMGSEESTLLRAITESGGKIIYDPEAVVGHIITGDRLQWDYFERLAVGIGRSLALADPIGTGPAGFVVRLGRVCRSFIALVRATTACWITRLTGGTPYRRHDAIRRRITAASRLAVHWQKLWHPHDGRPC